MFASFALLMLASAPSSQPASLPAYPEAWIAEARAADPKLSCQQLVYKRGCKELRTGRITLHVGLDEKGKVVALKTVKNEIRRDPKVVEKCAKDSVKQWPFKAPDGVAADFDVVLVLSDKC